MTRQGPEIDWRRSSGVGEAMPWPGHADGAGGSGVRAPAFRKRETVAQCPHRIIIHNAIDN
jgi:hypothetical protein